MDKILSALKNIFYKPAHKSQTEAWLAESKDVFELENKMKLLKYKGYWI